MGTPERSAGRDLAALVRVLPSLGAGPLVAGLVIGLGAAVVGVGINLAAGGAVDALVALQSGIGDRAGLARALGIVAALYLVSQILTQLATIVGGLHARRVNGELRERVMVATLAPAATDELQRPEVGAAIDRCRELAPMGVTPGEAGAAVVNQFHQHVGALLAAVALAGLGLWPLAAAMVLLRVVVMATSYRLFWRQLAFVAGGGTDQRRARWYRDLSLRPHAAKELRIFGLAGWATGRGRAASEAALAAAGRDRLGHRNLVDNGVMVLGEVITVMGALVWLAFRLLDGRIDADVLVAGTLLANTVGRVNLDNSLLALSYGSASIPRVVELERLIATLPPSTSSVTSGPVPTLRDELRIEGLTYTYPGADRPVVSDLDLVVPAGQRLAVVGLNGAGKTTLVKLFAGLLTPTEGRICFDGTDVSDLPTDRWRPLVAALFQRFVHYDLSVRDNIALTDPANAPDDAALWSLLADVGLDETVRAFHAGLDTVLAPDHAEGTDLSGGQWQRLALARALHAVGRGARLLFLDEPTANLDVRAEAALYERFLDLTASAAEDPLTTILISHRFSTVRRADRIVVLDAGRIVEDGTHDELVAAGGRYAELYTLQATRYRTPNDGDTVDRVASPAAPRGGS